MNASRETLEAMSPDHANISALVVEDDEDLSAILVHLLEDLSCQALKAASAEEALAILARRPVDFVVSDMRLPGMDGLGLLKACRALPGRSGVRFLALTGDPILVEAARAAGADAVLLKPFQLKALREVLAQFLPPRTT